MSQIRLIFMTTVVLLCMDGLWLGCIGKQLYLDQMKDLLRLDQNGTMNPNFFAAAMVYVVLIMGLFVFVFPKANGQPMAAFGWGALFGFVCYAIYDFTNLAILEKWPIWLSFIDVLWGCVLCGVTSFIVVSFNKSSI